MWRGQKMATTDNLLQAVATYNKSALGRLVNMFAGINKANKKFKNFQDVVANLGNSVTYDSPPRAFSYPGLVVSSFDSIEQLVYTLTIGGYDSSGIPTPLGAYDSYGNLNAANTNLSVSSEQLIFNIDNNDYRQPLEEAYMSELGNTIESSILNRFINDTYRFYTAGIDYINNVPLPINSYGQLAFAESQFCEYGCAQTDYEAFIPNMAVSNIISQGLNKFILDRNNEAYNSWELGKFGKFDWYRSNLLPVQIAGTLGNVGAILPITSFVTDSDGGISSITCSGAGTDATAINAGDLGFFMDGVAGQPNIRYLTYTGHNPSELQVQFQATANASSSAGNVTFSILPKLYSAPGKNQNISVPVAPGMQIQFLPSHRAGVMYSGKPFYLGMPRLPDQAPFATAQKSDPVSGASIRFTQGAAFGQNITGFIWDQIWGAKLTSPYAMRLIFPITTPFAG